MSHFLTLYPHGMITHDHKNLHYYKFLGNHFYPYKSFVGLHWHHWQFQFLSIVIMINEN